MPFLPPARLRERQARRVRAMVRHAWETVPFYRDGMRAAGLDPREVRDAGDLWRLPRARGADLAAEPERFVSPAHAGDGVVLRSSGSTGYPKSVRHTPASMLIALAHGRRQRAVFARFVGRSAGYRELRVARVGSASTLLREFYESRLLLPRGADLERAFLSITEPFERLAAVLDESRPDVLYGYGSHLGAFYRWLHERGRAVHRPRLLWYGADAMPAADRDLVEATFGVPVVSTYQANEALRLGFQCELRRGFHLSLDDVAVRVEGADGRPVAPGEAGRLVISNLTNRATVLLNYELGDLVTVSAAPCPCGRSLPTLEAIDGRADDLLVRADGTRLHALALVHRLLSLAGVTTLQLEQQTPWRLVVRVVAAPGGDAAALESGIAAAVRSSLGAGVEIAVEPVAELRREPSGKVRHVVSRCAPGRS